MPMTAVNPVGWNCQTAAVRPPDLEALMGRLADRPGREDSLVHVEVRPAREARYADWPAWVSPEVVAALARTGVPRPWAHQAEAAGLAHAGRHCVVATGTASGKSLAYL